MPNELMDMTPEGIGVTKSAAIMLVEGPKGVTSTSGRCMHAYVLVG